MRRHIALAVLAVVPLVMLIIAACSSGPGNDEPHCACTCQDATGFVFDNNAFCPAPGGSCLTQCNNLGNGNTVCTNSNVRPSTCQ